MNKRVKLWNIEFVFLRLLHFWELLWWRLNVVEDTLVYEEVHEVDSELILDLGLVLDALLNDVANLIDGGILGRGGDTDPVVELLIKFL